MAERWQAWRVDYRAESPVHIGWHRLGGIRRTRYYIPGRNLWGAWAARWARREGSDGFNAGHNPYQEAECDLRRWVRFTAFFPVMEGGLLRPKYERGEGLRYGGLTPGEFEARYVHGVASTAIAPPTLTAFEGALHEREYVHAPGMRFQGYVLVESSCPWARLVKEVERLQLGGNIGYGYGLLRMVEHRDARMVFEEYAVDEAGRLRSAGSSWLAGFCATAGVEAEGELEVLSGRGSRGGAGAGQDVKTPGRVWTPGSRVDDGGVFEIDSEGGWRRS